jgi:hypothetical protein
MTSMLYPINFKHITIEVKQAFARVKFNQKNKGLRKRLTIRVRVNLKKETI